MKSLTSVKQSEIAEKWYLIDAEGARIGRLATIAAELLQGKTNPLTKKYLKPMVKVVVVNAKKIDFTAKKGMTKFYKRYSGFPGGLKFISLEDTMKLHPERPLENAIKGMLPKTKMGNDIFSNLNIYSDDVHPHQAQTLEKIDIRNFKI